MLNQEIEPTWAQAVSQFPIELFSTAVTMDTFHRYQIITSKYYHGKKKSVSLRNYNNNNIKNLLMISTYMFMYTRISEIHKHCHVNIPNYVQTTSLENDNDQTSMHYLEAPEILETADNWHRYWAENVLRNVPVQIERTTWSTDSQSNGKYVVI